MRIHFKEGWGLAAAALALGLLGAGNRTAGAVSAGQVVSEIHAINQLEIMMGQLAEQKGSTPRVRRYGQLLARDHRLGDTQLLALARDQHLGVAASATTPAEHAMMQHLQGLSGKAFDREFLSDMKTGHDQAIATLKASRGQLTNPTVRDFVGKLIPVLGQHRDLSQHLERKA